jgi:hypothetical protein
MIHKQMGIISLDWMRGCISLVRLEKGFGIPGHVL